METQFTNKEAVDYIEEFTWSTTRLGLERTRELLAGLGNPQDKLKFIHVAGTNGKGSTCAMTESILRHAGLKTGLYTSPYIQSFYEQLKVNNEPILPEELAEIVSIVAPVADAMEDHPSRFELLTAVAMLYFLRQQCDIVILEVGMGGELDSTNIIPPALVSVIANIGLDHTEYLGDNISQIARTKAGIIKPGTIVVAYDSGEEALDEIRAKCLLEGCELNVCDFDSVKTVSMSIDGQVLKFPDYPEIYLSLSGNHQKNNAVLAMLTIEALKKRGYSISDKSILDGFSDVKWPARFEVLMHSPLFILDGGHNPQCAGALTDSLATLYPGQKFLFLMGILEDKDVDSILKMVIPLASDIITVTPDSPRAMEAENLCAKIKEMEPKVSVSPYLSIKEGLEEAIYRAVIHDIDVVCFGSLYLAGEIKDNFVKAGKQAQRQVCIKRRQDMSDEMRAEESRIICEKLKENPDVIKAQTIFSYKAMASEADLSDFDDWARSKGKHVAYPVTDKNGNMEFWEPNGSDGFINGNYRITEPNVSSGRLCSINEADIIIMPCVGFDDRGRRLGHGAGYYDKYLKDAPDKKLLIVGLNSQKLKEIICDENDKDGEIISP